MKILFVCACFVGCAKLLVLKQERDCLSIGVMHLSLLVERGRERAREIEKGPIYQSAA